ncbi:MAG: hypothetical protein MZU84_04120 [Sphingobacterium sp.]|nr:hypothetical protein [Sphingobacterium sp.]
MALGARHPQQPADRPSTASSRRRQAHRCLVMNLCDGNEVDGSPGVSVVRALEDCAASRTPAVPRSSTTSPPTRWPLKTDAARARRADGALRARCATCPSDLARLEAEVGFPAFVKPEVSAGSGGIGLKSRAHDAGEVMARVDGAARERGRRVLPQVGHLRRAVHRRARVHGPRRGRQTRAASARGRIRRPSGCSTRRCPATSGS